MMSIVRNDCARLVSRTRWRKQVVDRFVAELYVPLSQVRLESYRHEADSDLDMLTNYFWNIDLAESLVPSLHAVELAVRNSIHATLTAHFDDELWFYKPGVLGWGQIGQLANALENLSRKRAEPTPGRIVAALTFGFWVALLSGNYERDLWQPDGFRLLHQAFPHASPASRKQVHTRLNRLRELRNRVFHHEEVWHLSHLPVLYDEIYETIGWISPVLQQAIRSVDNFPAVIAGRAEVEANLKSLLDFE
jgi:hypothetical protein